ncbi:MAG: hypothetical protein M3271_06440, partial [Actinomycetota bacterium]|nr:hypothetical protein [Actinomycetota bacterium]
RELARWRGGRPPSKDLIALDIDAAIERRNRGNIPDAAGRSLRLVLRIDTEQDLKGLDSKRLRLEPDFLDPPTWRREGSRPVHVVPLRAPGVAPDVPRRWQEDPELAPLEWEWARTGTAAGLKIPADFRAFIYKTILALQVAQRDVTIEAIVASLSRWLDEAQVAEIDSALRKANETP